MNIPWAAIKAVSDDANGNSASNFQANLKYAARLAAEAAQGMIADLPQG
jgi:adenosylhomocysteine nucleosidase